MNELTREQVEEQLENIHFGSVDVRVKSMACILRHDAALRQRAEQAERELQQEREKCDSIRNRFPIDAAIWRGVDEYDLCAECSGAGTKLYGNTSTYHYSAGGQAVTWSVCDKCWGSGNKHKPWRSWKLEDLQERVEQAERRYATAVQTRQLLRSALREARQRARDAEEGV